MVTMQTDNSAKARQSLQFTFQFTIFLIGMYGTHIIGCFYTVGRLTDASDSCGVREPIQPNWVARSDLTS